MIAAHFGEPSLSVAETLYMVFAPFLLFAAAYYIYRLYRHLRRKP